MRADYSMYVLHNKSRSIKGVLPYRHDGEKEKNTMKKILLKVAAYMLFGTITLGITLYGLIMWSEEVMMYVD